MDIFKNHFYINLDHRTDRRESIINELKKIGIENPNRLPAIKTEWGIVGCCLSHIRCIQEAIENDWDHVVIFEDDIIIKRPDLLIRKVKKLINNDWDCLLLSGNNFKPYIEYEDYIKVSKCFCMSSYIIKKHYYQKLLDNLNEGLKLLLNSGDRKYSNDYYNHKLQREDTWYLLTPITIYQKEDYSDIEKKNVNYKKLMLNIDK
jgi:GR25 family glycosyltransferase involved in LPS biosynthesis